MKTFRTRIDELYVMLAEGEIDEDQLEALIEELESEEFFNQEHSEKKKEVMP